MPSRAIVLDLHRIHESLTGFTVMDDDPVLGVTRATNGWRVDQEEQKRLLQVELIQLQ